MNLSTGAESTTDTKADQKENNLTQKPRKVCFVSDVRCKVSGVRCQVSHVTCHIPLSLMPTAPSTDPH